MNIIIIIIISVVIIDIRPARTTCKKSSLSS